jgi:hypothetical protein
MNFWIFAGVFSARNVRRFLGDKPKLSCPELRFARLFNRPPRSKAKPATLLESPQKYTGANPLGV